MEEETCFIAARFPLVLLFDDSVYQHTCLAASHLLVLNSMGAHPSFVVRCVMP